MIEKLKRYKIQVIVLLIIVVSIPLTLIQLSRQQETRSRASTAPAISLALNPQTSTHQVNTDFDVELRINTSTNNVSAVDITIDYDSSILTLASFTPASTFSTMVNDSQTIGILHYVGTNPPGSSITGTDVSIGTMKFKGTAIGTTSVAFKDIQAAAQGQGGTPLPIDTANTKNGSYTITAATVIPTVTPPSTVTIRGHFVDQNGNDLNSDIGQDVNIILVTTAYPVNKSGFAIWGNNTLPPMFNYTVGATDTPGYTISYSTCINCINHTTYSPGRIAINIDLPNAGDYADIYFKYTPIPTATPTPTTGVNPTPTTIIPTPCQGANPNCNGTQIALDIGIDGIGSVGDHTNPDPKDSTQNPQHPTRNVTVELYNSSETLVSTFNGTIQYNSATGRFTGTVGLAQTASGNYIVKVKSLGTIKKRLPGITTLVAGQTHNASQVNLVVGDLNSDNHINIADYNILNDCIFAPAATHGTVCSQNPDYAVISDLNDNGIKNILDYSLLVREIIVQDGD